MEMDRNQHYNCNWDYHNHRCIRDIDPTTLALIITFSIAAFIFVCCCTCCLVKRCRSRQTGRVINGPSVPVPANNILVPNYGTPVIPNYQTGIVQQTGANGESYMVPFTALPRNFNYSSPDVEVRDNHVIIRDLRLLDDQNTSNNRDVPPPYMATLEYQTQTPYNPNYSRY